MSKYKQFIQQQKINAIKKAVEEGKMPEQGSFITLFNNNYKVLTKPDSKITILEDNRANKIAYPRESIVKMLSESMGETVEKAENGPRTLTGTNKLVGAGDIGSKAKPKAAAGGTPAKPVDPVGTVRNGRKKVVSKRTGQTMWIDIANGTAHGEHDTHESQPASPEAEAQTKEFFDAAKNNLHPGDKMKLQRQMKDLMTLKQKAMNMLDMAHQDDRQKLPEAQMTRKRVFELQDQYKKAFEQFKSDVKASAQRRKKEFSNE